MRPAVPAIIDNDIATPRSMYSFLFSHDAALGNIKVSISREGGPTHQTQSGIVLDEVTVPHRSREPVYPIEN